MYKKTILFTLLSLLSFSPVLAQYTQVGTGGFQSFTYGPMSTIDSTPFFNRHAYIYPAGSISGLSHGDTIRSISFMRTGSDTLAGIANFKIYLKNTSKANFGSSALNWKAEVRDSGMTLVYSKNPREDIGSQPGLVNFPFNQASYYIFDTTNNATNMQVLVEYTQQTNQFNPIAWYNESSFYVPSFVSNNESKYLSGGASNWNDSISTGSFQIKPTIRFNHPDKKVNLEVRNIYALGRFPIKMKTADTVKAIIENIGLDTVYNHKVYLNVSGVNSYTDSITIAELAPLDPIIIRFGNYIPTNQGSELLTVRIAPDGDTTDNSNSKARLINYNIYTHADPFNGNLGGIGFNGSTGDFVAKFYVNNTDFINQVKVDFSSSNRSFQIGIWDDDGPGGLPGTNIYTSDTMLTIAGTFILNLDPKVQVSGGYYVGVRQTSNTNVAFSYQAEVPVRPHVFYFTAPMGDTSWTPFSPGFNFNFNIQPRIQVSNDLSISKIIVPKDGELIPYSTTDSISPKVVVNNYGSVNQSNFQVKLKILNKFNQTIYSSTRTISLASEDSAHITFDKFSLYNLGDFIAQASVDLNVDSVKDNNVLESDFTLYKNHDVAADIIFEPAAGDTFEMNSEGFWPQVRIYNYGLVRQVNFPVTVRLLDGDSVLASQTVLETLDGEASKILAFDSIYPSRNGWLRFEAYTSLFRDSFPSNDTASVQIYGRKSFDIAVLNVLNPLPNSQKATNINFKPFVNFRNIGLSAQDSIYLYAKIFAADGSLIYTDTALKSLNFYTTAQALFKDFNTGTKPAFYKFTVEAYIVKDQDQSNDTLSSWFEVVQGRDLRLLSIDTPLVNELIEVNAIDRPVVFTLKNNGLVNASNVPIYISIRDEQLDVAFADTVLVESILSNETRQFKSKLLSFLSGGQYTISVVNGWTQEDKRTSNDSIHSSYTVKYQKDIAITKHNNPFDSQEIDINTHWKPQLEIANFGIDSSITEAVIYSVLNPSSIEIFRDTLWWSSLLAEEVLVLNSSDSFKVQSEGLYTVNSTLLIADNNSANDSLQTFFTVFRNYDARIDSSSLPKQDYTLEIKTTYQPIIWVSNVGLKDLDSNVVVECIVSVDNNVIYNLSEQIKLDVGQALPIEFDSSLRYPDNALAEAMIIVSHPLDLSRSNDTLKLSFQFSDKASIPSVIGTYCKVYPNPFHNTFVIESRSEIIAVDLINAFGQLLYSNQNVNSTNLVVDNQLAAGVYRLRVQTDLGVEYLQLIKE